MAIEIIIDSDQQKTYAKSLIDQMPIDGSCTVITKKTDVSPTARQRRLRWKWMGEIAQSGLGQNDTKDGVDMYCKWKFARPILLRDSEVFGASFAGFENLVKDYDPFLKKELYKEFTRDYISPEKLMTKAQEAEYLRDIQNFWTRLGVEMTDPSMMGLDLTRKPKEEQHL